MQIKKERKTIYIYIVMMYKKSFKFQEIAATERRPFIVSRILYIIFAFSAERKYNPFVTVSSQQCLAFGLVTVGTRLACSQLSSPPSISSSPHLPTMSLSTISTPCRITTWQVDCNDLTVCTTVVWHNERVWLRNLDLTHEIYLCKLFFYQKKVSLTKRAILQLSSSETALSPLHRL